MTESLIQLACPRCASLNRVAVQRLADGPRCGRCHEAMFDGKPLELTAANFDRHAERSDLPLLIDFWAPWCGPCLSMAPQFAAAVGLLEPLVRVAKLDTEAETELAGRFAIRSIPTLVLLDSGRELARQSGAMSRDQIVQWTRMQLREA